MALQQRHSEEELFAHISCTENSIPTYIDFDQYTLLVVNGAVTSTISYLFPITKSLVHCFNQYELDINIHLSDGAIPTKWSVALIVDKLNTNGNL